MQQASSPGRILSMDEFRGYTVFGMFLVNFFGGLAAIHVVLKHNNTYFSYADSIMPSFIFAVGFSYRLTLLKRRAKWGFFKTYYTYVRRSIALVLVSLMVFGLGGGFKDWYQYRAVPEKSIESMGPNGKKNLEEWKTKDLEWEASLTQTGDPEAESEESDETATDETKSGSEQTAEDNDTGPVEATKPVLSDDSKDKDAAKDPEKKADEAAKDEKKKKDDKPAEPPLIDQSAELDLKDSDTEIEVPENFGDNWKMFALKLIKADLWEVLAIIGVTQIFIMPVIAAPGWIRFLAMVACGLGHAYITHLFNWDFAHGLRWDYSNGPIDTSMDALWGIQGVRSWDGGVFGIMAWAVAMLAGTLSHDIIVRHSRGKAAGRLVFWGMLLMVVGYGMSCLTRLYDLETHPSQLEIGKVKQEAKEKYKALKIHVMNARQAIMGADESVYKRLGKEAKAEGGRIKAEAEKKIKEIQAANKEELDRIAKANKPLVDKRKPGELAASPVIPPFERAEGRAWTDLLAEPPFVQPPPLDPTERAEGERGWVKNYWMMGKRIVNLSFITFSSGFAFALYGLFVVFTDLWGIQIGLFRTFGMNPLAAYVIHELVMHSMLRAVPGNSPLWFCLAAFLLCIS
jgi:predicted acyltransferase